MRKFSVRLILEVPLIVLQYYKPSIFLYIYIHIRPLYEGSIYVNKYLLHKTSKITGVVVKRRDCKFIYNFNCADLLRFQSEVLKFGLRTDTIQFLGIIPRNLCYAIKSAL